MVHKILLVDDEVDILEFLEYNLRKEGFEVRTAENGADAVKIVRNFAPHLVLLDVMMPVMDGFEACKEIRETAEGKNAIIAFLTARGEDYSQIAGFDAGADDYITKPIRPKVLISRIGALLKRLDISAETKDDFVIDRDRYILRVKGEDISMPRKEFELISLLHSIPDKVFTREEIFSAVWDDKVIVGDRTIDVHIRKIREKIGDDYVVTIKGVGYKFSNGGSRY